LKITSKVELGAIIHELVKAGYLIGDWKTREMKNGKMKATRIYTVNFSGLKN